MQKNKKCDDFEVRFCCSKIDRPEILSTKQPVYNESVDLEELTDINDLRKMNKYLKISEIISYQNYFHSNKRPFTISVPSMIGLECESGNVVDCELSMTIEVLPFSCKGKIMFSSDSEEACGTKCNNSQSRINNKSPIRRGWTKYMRYTNISFILKIYY